MFPDVLLPGSAELELEHLDADPTAIVLTLHPTRSDAPCPRCVQPSTRIHAQYRRTLADRPWAGVPVRLRLRLRKFVCRNPSCPQAVFVERLPTVVAPFAQRSLRLAEINATLSLSMAAKPGHAPLPAQECPPARIRSCASRDAHPHLILSAQPSLGLMIGPSAKGIPMARLSSTSKPIR